MREHFLSQDRMAAEHVFEEFVGFPAKGAHDANAGKGFAHAAVDAFGVFAEGSVDWAYAACERKTHEHRARDDGHGGQRKPPVEAHEDAYRNDEPYNGN